MERDGGQRRLCDAGAGGRSGQPRVLGGAGWEFGGLGGFGGGAACEQAELDYMWRCILPIRPHRFLCGMPVLASRAG